VSFKRTHDIAVKVGSYEKDGKTKNRYENVGYVLTSEDGGKMYFLNRTFNPAGVPIHEGNEGTVLLGVFEVRGGSTASEPAKQEAPAASGDEGFADDIPF
jgi:hypothetical protein